MMPGAGPEVLGRRRDAPDPELARVAFSGWRRSAGAPARGPTMHRSSRRCWGSRRRPPTSSSRIPRRWRASPTSTARAGGRLDAELARRRRSARAAGGPARLPAPRDAAGRRARPRGAPLEEVVAEISAVAEACSRGGRAARRRRHARRRSASGKLGGAELNYSSDVDLLFVHEEAGPGAQEAAERAAADLIAAALRAHRRGHRAPRRPALRPGRPGRAPRAARSRPRSRTTSGTRPPGSARP